MADFQTPTISELWSLLGALVFHTPIHLLLGFVLAVAVSIWIVRGIFTGLVEFIRLLARWNKDNGINDPDDT